MKGSIKILSCTILVSCCLTACSSLRPSAGDTPTGKEGIVLQTQVGQGGFIQNTNLVIYPGAKGAADIGESFVSFVSSDNAEKIRDFYLKELSDKDWIVNEVWTKDAKPALPSDSSRLIAARKTQIIKLEFKPSPKDSTRTLILPVTMDESTFLKEHPELK
ncbi:MAG: hypothetical protein KIT34_05080 [Cyanobacteria bacterium TGS_CYA1]|nr:hypothetical protein [Cyanobacteria bacterium TGS_CYA1]